MTKAWWKSKTIWFNALIAALLLAEQNVGALQGLISDTLQKTIVFTLPIVNMMLRTISTHGLSFKPTMPADQGEPK